VPMGLPQPTSGVAEADRVTIDVVDELVRAPWDGLMGVAEDHVRRSRHADAVLAGELRQLVEAVPIVSSKTIPNRRPAQKQAAVAGVRVGGQPREHPPLDAADDIALGRAADSRRAGAIRQDAGLEAIQELRDVAQASGFDVALQ